MKIYSHRNFGFGIAMFLLGIIILMGFLLQMRTAPLKKTLKAGLLAAIFLIGGGYLTVYAFSPKSAPHDGTDGDEKQLH